MGFTLHTIAAEFIAAEFNATGELHPALSPPGGSIRPPITSPVIGPILLPRVFLETISFNFSKCHSSSRLLTIFDACNMEGPTKIYQSLSMPPNSRRKQRNLAQTAPVAAKFEDCHQCFTRLCVALKTLPSTSDLDLAEDSFAKFLAWGNDTGAMSRSLDHTLRKASAHQKKTLELLTTLHSTLMEGMRLFIFKCFLMVK